MKQRLPVHWRAGLQSRWHTAFVLLAGLCCASCDLLQTRDPEPPTKDNSTYESPKTPEMLLRNFRTSVEEKNTQEYEKVFADSALGGRSYSFIPSQGSLVRYGVVFSLWTNETERDYFRKAVSSLMLLSTPVLIFEKTTMTKFQSDSALYECDYDFSFNHQEPTLTKRLKGRSFLYLLPNKVTQNWVIYRWEDYETAKDSSWSELKGYFSK
jgi:hypothetical protein